jgi:hypothetical protein
MEKLSSDRNLVRDRPHPFVVSRSSFAIRSALTGRPNPPLPHSHSRHGSPPSLIQRGPDLAQKHLAIVIRGIRAFGGMRVSACSAIVRSGWAGTSGHSEAV